ncbi:MAG: mobile mystery protein A [Deltaproteobacteria bacterium]|nr:mobile mystery protein A [Deltaproteobacteria bacterium]
MRAKYKKLTTEQLDTVLSGLEPLKTLPIPPKGWVRAVRDALGMSARQLAQRLGVKQQRIVRIEQDEKQGKVTLNTLQNVAEAMDCIFVYGLVPRESLQQTIQEQARRAAIKRMSRSNQMMRLEKQELTAPQKQKALHEMIEEILNTMPRTLWDE